MTFSINYFFNTYIIIKNKYKKINVAVKVVVTIASHLLLSNTIPIIPVIKETGIPNNTDNAPSVASGVPQVGLKIEHINITTTAIKSKVMDILPYLIRTNLY